MKFGALYCVYDDHLWLRQSLESVYDASTAIFILIGELPWNGIPRDQDQTFFVITNFPDKDKKISIVRGNWKTETQQRNEGIELLKNNQIDYCFVVDADEVYDTSELKNMMQYAESDPKICCWHMHWETYWKSPRFHIVPQESFKPAVFLKIGHASFIKNRLVKADKHSLIPAEVGICHHLSYARPDEYILRKITSFSHAGEVSSLWFEEVWKKWDSNPNLTHLHPTHPVAFHCALPQPYRALPPALRNSKVSIIIPTRFREHSLKSCIEAIVKNTSDYPDFEINVFRDEGAIPMGCPKATNEALKQCTGDYIAYIGNDCLPQPGFLLKAMALMKESFKNGIGMVGFNDPIGEGSFQHFIIHRALIEELLDNKIFSEEYIHNWCNNELLERITIQNLYRYSKDAVVLHSWWSEAACSPGAPIREKDECDARVEQCYAIDTIKFYERKPQWDSRKKLWNLIIKNSGNPASVLITSFIGFC